MKRVALWMIAALAATACHSKQHADPAQASNQSVSGASATSDGTLQQGNYQYDSRTIELAIPGKPADYGAKQIAMEKSGAILTRLTHCVSRAEALDPRLIFSLGDKACHYAHYSMTGGRIDAQLVCQHGPQTETRTITGTYTPTSLSTDVTINVTGGPESGEVNKSHVDVKRIGDCPGNG
jgi:hypothetical protein